MKKVILFSILSVLLYSAPGHATWRGDGSDMKKALRGKGKGHATGRGTGDMNQALRGKGKGHAAGSKKAAQAEMDRAVAEEAAAREEEEREKSRTAAPVARRQAAVESIAEATVAPATEAAPTRTSLERQLEGCVGSFEQTVLTHAQGVMLVLQGREDALNKHLLRLNVRMGAISDRNLYQPLCYLMPPREHANHPWLRRMDDICVHASSIKVDACHQVAATLAGLAQDKKLVSTIMQKAADLQLEEVTPEAAVQDTPPVGVAEEAAAILAEEAEVEAFLAAEEGEEAAAEEAQTVEGLKVLCEKIKANNYKLPSDKQPQEINALAKKTLSEMEDILNEMDLERMKIWHGSMVYHDKVRGLLVTGRDAVEKTCRAINRCHEVLCDEATAPRQAAQDASTPESTGAAPDMESPLAKFRKCNALLSDFNTCVAKIHQRCSAEDETCSQQVADVYFRGRDESKMLLQVLFGAVDLWVEESAFASLKETTLKEEEAGITERIRVVAEEEEAAAERAAWQAAPVAANEAVNEAAFAEWGRIQQAEKARMTRKAAEKEAEEAEAAPRAHGAGTKEPEADK